MIEMGGKLLIVAGLVLIALGLLWLAAERFGLGRLPGDILIRGQNYSVYLPLATCLILSLLLTLALWLLQKWRQ
jgi:hypothetical protein